VEALRSSPGLKAYILEMLDITGGRGFEELNLGDDAENATDRSANIYSFHLKATQENRIEISLKSNKKTRSILT
jgi:hypothetical protein